jgi:DNA repair protein RecO (recombination protein O)
MPLVATPAVVLHVTPYGETSKVVRLLTRDLGTVGAMARGARRKKSRAGPRLELFAEGVATLLARPHVELHPLTAFDVEEAHTGLARDLGRFGAASALLELALKCAPAGPHHEVFDAVSSGLNALENAPTDAADAVALAACWSLVSALGFSPATDQCAVCGVPTAGTLYFAPAAGGSVCPTHREGQGRVHELAPQDRSALAVLTQGRAPPALDSLHAAAHRRLLVAFIRHHLAEHRPLPAMAFWDAEAWNATSS